MSKQTAVDKFHDAVNDMIARRRPMTSNEVAKIWLECKEMEKEQIRKAYCDGEHYKDTKLTTDYYNETYGGNK
jgi:hypothetical protein